MTTGFAFPSGDCVEPELNESKRASEFRASELNNIRIVREVIEAFANVSAVKSAAVGVRDVVKLFGHENAFIAGIRRRLGKAGVVDVVSGAPGKVGPVCASFENVVLKIIFVEKDETAFVAKIGKLLEAAPVPGIVFCEVVATKSVPRRPHAAAGKRLFVEWRPDVASHPAHALVIVAAAVVPKAVMMIQSGNTVGGEGVDEFSEIIGKAGTNAARNETGKARASERRFGGTEIAAPPGDVGARANKQATVAGKPAVGDGK